MNNSLCEYLVSHGPGGGVGRFAAGGAVCARGDRVVIETGRGLELGVVLCAATERHARLMAAPAAGRLLRVAGADDEALARRLHQRAQGIFETCRRAAAAQGLPVEILDVELLFDGGRAVVQHLRWGECDFAEFAECLRREHGVEVWLDDLSVPAAPAEEEHGGCGKPGCGQESGSCTSCGTGGGCGSCARGSDVDLRAYFAHLRAEMEQRRVPLL